ncbi:hypothetical protein HMPREF1565_2871 [Providencia alcalifaciens RIMD 1656011]|nr:hypothetical protein HMPREF1565_2871 [Providencia alcalifaciens RIMD 1656011]
MQMMDGNNIKKRWFSLFEIKTANILNYMAVFIRGRAEMLYQNKLSCAVDNNCFTMRGD